MSCPKIDECKKKIFELEYEELCNRHYLDCEEFEKKTPKHWKTESVV